MAKIFISVLRPNLIKTFIHNLTPGEAETIGGGGYPYGFYINNFTDTVNIQNYGGSNTIEAGGAYSVSYHDNKIHTIDYARSIYNTFA